MVAMHLLVSEGFGTSVEPDQLEETKINGFKFI